MTWIYWFTWIDGNMTTKNDVERELPLISERNLLQTIIKILANFQKATEFTVSYCKIGRNRDGF